MVDATSVTAMPTLSARCARGLAGRRWSTAPNASQGRQLGMATSMNKIARNAACAGALPACRSRKVATAATPISHPFGLIH
jgi:hypothetical protein